LTNRILHKNIRQPDIFSPKAALMTSAGKDIAPFWAQKKAATTQAPHDSIFSIKFIPCAPANPCFAGNLGARPGVKAKRRKPLFCGNLRGAHGFKMIPKQAINALLTLIFRAFWANGKKVEVFSGQYFDQRTCVFTAFPLQ
jgi:hypothetical protein